MMMMMMMMMIIIIIMIIIIKILLFLFFVLFPSSPPLSRAKNKIKTMAQRANFLENSVVGPDGVRRKLTKAEMAAKLASKKVTFGEGIFF
jgi:hypothetical protein